MAGREDGINHSPSVLGAADLCRQEVPLEHATIATVKSILFCQSRLPEDTWNLGYPVPNESSKSFLLLATTKPTLKFELRMITKDPTSHMLEQEVAQSFNIPSKNFNMSVRVYDETLDYQRC